MKKLQRLVVLLLISIGLTTSLTGFKSEAPIYRITVSTDGELYTYVVNEEYVGVDWLTENFEPMASVPSWSNSGDILAFASSADGSWQINMWKDGVPIAPIKVASEPWAISWSPDDTHLAYTSLNQYPKPFNVDVAEIESGTLTRLTTHAAACCVGWLSNNEVMFMDRPRDDRDAVTRGNHSIAMLATLQGNQVISIDPSEAAAAYFDWSAELELIDQLPVFPGMLTFEAAWNKQKTLAAAYMNNQPSRVGGPIVQVVIYEYKFDGKLGIRFIHSGEFFNGFSWNPAME